MEKQFSLAFLMLISIAAGAAACSHRITDESVACHKKVNSGPLELVALNHVSREATDLPKMVDFYKNVLGFREHQRPEFEFGGSWLLLAPNIMMHLIERDHDAVLREGPSSAPADAVEQTCEKFLRRGHHLAFRCLDIDVVKQKLNERGIPYHSSSVPNTDVQQVFFFDPEGNGIEIGNFAEKQPPPKEEQGEY
eukprot:CAMPEP_0113935900 /NCGR_PEP_ID=MMETSP1339-20121228/2933_1 /TAXON_ID=94617 /ORGANISM="Fibrocapsa japonica" /LENGTH=193 /DNA_ID=CAMNT_0000938191 /DNA_START=101 /DNA_END=682 /DNA_ORIENTATION=+ /assembly_acc=CAM_ASM_000762